MRGNEIPFELLATIQSWFFFLARKAANTWIYYTNRSGVSTKIWAEFATKLCFFRLAAADTIGRTARLQLSYDGPSEERSQG
jgi:hypothetical protein